MLGSIRIRLVVSLLALALLTAVLAPTLGEPQLLDVALLYLVVTLLSAALGGYVVGLTTAVLSSLIVNFFFVPPLHRLTVQSPENAVALLLFLAVALVGASMLSRLRRQAAIATARELEMGILLRGAQAVVATTTPDEAVTAYCTAVADSLDLRGVALLRDERGWHLVGSTRRPEEGELIAGADIASATKATTTDAIVEGTNSTRIFVPGRASPPAVLRIIGRIQLPPFARRDELLRAIAAEGEILVERAALTEEAHRAVVLERSDEMKSTLLSSLSHDLRSPLTAIKAAVGSLRTPDVQWTDDDKESFLETIESQADRLIAVVGELLDMSRLESGTEQAHIERVQVHPLLHDVQNAARVTVETHPLVVDARSDLWALADYRLTMQALTNLVENAARYSVPLGTIRLSAEAASPDGVSISVADDGPGIPEADLPHVFEKSYRGVQTRRTRGTGLGLAITKAMVELSGGEISVRSSLHGTTFTIRLPRAEPPA